MDGSGSRGYAADVGISDDRIAAIGQLSEAPSRSRKNVSGMYIAPGFIDTHTHDDAELIKRPAMTMKVSQGVTSVVIGNCGVSLGPSRLRQEPPPPLNLLGGLGSYQFARMADYFRRLDGDPPAVNVVSLVGHMTLRASTMARLDRPADSSELQEMKLMLESAFDDGAVGFSSGLAYSPSGAATASEVAALASCAGRRNCLYCAHIRDEADGVMTSLCEACDTARISNVPLVISHHKVMGQANFGRSVATLEYLDRRAKSQPLAIDAYPYTASSTILRADRVSQSKSVLITWSKAMPAMAGRTLTDIAAALGCCTDDAIARLQPAGAVYFVMDETDVRRILAWPRTMIGSDGIPGDEFPHPRLWGTFPRVLGHYARDQSVMTIETAVRRMTGLPAEVFGLRHRGRVQQGFFADLVVFDPTSVADQASFTDPITPSTGIELVFVNGQVSFSEGRTSGRRPGRVLRRQELDPPMVGSSFGATRHDN